MSNCMADRLVDELSHLAARYACAPAVVDRPGAPVPDGSVSAGKPDSKPPAGVDYPLQAALVSFARRLIDAHQAADELSPPIDAWKPPRSLGQRHETTDEDGNPRTTWTPEPSDPSITVPNPDLIVAMSGRLTQLVYWAESASQPIDSIARNIRRAKAALDKLNVGERPNMGPICANYTKGCTNDPREGRNYCTPCQRYKERYGQHRTVPSPC